MTSTVFCGSAARSKTAGHRLRSEAVVNERTLKEGHPKYARPGLKKLKEKLGEKSRSEGAVEWGLKANLPEKYG
jgi:hydroxymethylglutaryl-CoA lyase